ncbi:MAG: hypothetical protein QXX95_03615 [Nitrososphaerales archaeon]
MEGGLKDKSFLLIIAFLSSFPKTIRKKYVKLDKLIKNFNEIFSKNLILKVKGLYYSSVDFESLKVINPKYEE